MFQKFTPQAFSSETNLQSGITSGKSDETGEPDFTEVRPNEPQKEEKQMKNLFEMKSSIALSSESQNVPDVLKINSPSFNKMDEPVLRPVEKVLVEKSKENTRETSETVAQKEAADRKENIVKPFAKAAVKPSVFASATPSITSPTDVTGKQKLRYYLLFTAFSVYF